MSELSPEELEKFGRWVQGYRDHPGDSGEWARWMERLLAAYKEQRELITDCGAIIEALHAEADLLYHRSAQRQRAIKELQKRADERDQEIKNLLRARRRLMQEWACANPSCEYRGCNVFDGHPFGGCVTDGKDASSRRTSRDVAPGLRGESNAGVAELDDPSHDDT